MTIEFYELGFQNYLKVSGIQSNGIYDLLESINNNFYKYQEVEGSTIIFSIIVIISEFIYLSCLVFLRLINLQIIYDFTLNVNLIH